MGFRRLRSASVGNFAKFADVQSKKFTTVSCKQCAYAELYKGDTSMLSNILGLLRGRLARDC